LADLNLVRQFGEAESTGGRPAGTFAIDTTTLVVLAVDIGATHVRVALTDLESSILSDTLEPFSVGESPDRILDRVVEIVGDLLASAGRSLDDVAGVGVGVPVSVWQPTGAPRDAPDKPGWDGVDVVKELAPHFGTTPVIVDNDANLMALGEHTAAYPTFRNLLFVKVATGIGAGIISDGRLIHGQDGSAGDLAHIAIESAQGRECRCGNTGCLEAVAGGLALQADFAAEGFPVASSGDIVALARGGNTYAVSRLRTAGRDIGQVLAGAVSLLNPAVIVVGGKLSEAGEQLLAGIRESVYGRSLPLATKNLRIVTSTVLGQAGVLGASRLVLDHVLSEAGLVSLA
jgi:predicted NBD/HSP70 family sugar kinase